MAKQFISCTIKDARKLIKQKVPQDNQDDYKYRKLKREQKEIVVLRRKSFNKFNDDNDVIVVGRIRKRQLRYRDMDNPEKKQRKKIIGLAKLPLPEDTKRADLVFLNCKYKCYDIKKSKNRFVYGYAYVGDNKFLEVTRFNFLWILIPLLVALMLIIGLMQSPDVDLPSFIEGNPVVEQEDNPTGTQINPDLCYFTALPETTTLTDSRQTINLYNLELNDGRYYISYEIYIDGVLHNIVTKNGVFYLSNAEGSDTNTGAIPPDRQITVNLWEGLDEGTYDLICRTTEYDYDILEDIKVNGDKYSDKKKSQLLQKAVMPGEYKLATTLVVEK